MTSQYGAYELRGGGKGRDHHVEGSPAFSFVLLKGVASN